MAVLPTQDELEILIRYEPDTGKLYWLTRPGNKRWNSKYAGKEAFSYAAVNGYKLGSFFNVKCYAHRAIWKLVTGQDPRQVDHINGIRSDNRFENLRSVDGDRENTKNRAVPSHNTSGHMGVARCSKTNRWRAYIKHDGRQVFLGNYITLEDAVAARETAVIQYGYHENHGRHAQLYRKRAGDTHP